MSLNIKSPSMKYVHTIKLKYIPNMNTYDIISDITIIVQYTFFQ